MSEHPETPRPEATPPEEGQSGADQPRTEQPAVEPGSAERLPHADEPLVGAEQPELPLGVEPATAQAEQTAEPESATPSEPEPAAEAAVQPEAAAEPAAAEPEAVAEAEPAVEPEPDAVAEHATEREPEPAAEAETVGEPTLVTEPETVAEPEPETVAEPEPAAAAVAPTEPAHAVPTPAEVVHAPAPAAPAAAPASSAPPVVSDAASWGRVAEDGTVFVRTADGERAVGSYPGAEPAEALAYFARKYDELAGQVLLLEQRVRSGGVATKDAEATVTHLRESITDANAVGDLASLLTRLDGITGQLDERRKRSEAARAKARAEAAVTKERIVTEAETLSGSSDWKKAGDRLRELVEEWKKAPRLERKVDDALWKRFSAARTGFDKRRRVHFAELDEQRGEAAARKEKLIKKAEELSSSRDWADTAKAYRDLMTQWKAAGRARRDVEDKLWERFRAAQDVFFAARSGVFAERDSEQTENLEKKRALATEAEGLLPITDLKSARAALRHVHERWETIGHVPRNDRDSVENRLKKVDDAVRSAEEAEWTRSNPEARARAEATVSQLRTSIEKLEQDAAKARAAGQDKKAADAEAAVEARRSWLVEAEKTLAEFS